MKLIFQVLPPQNEGPHCSGILLVAVQHIRLFFYPSRSLFVGDDGFTQPSLGLALCSFFALHQAPAGLVMHTYAIGESAAACWTSHFLVIVLGGRGIEGTNTVMGWPSRRLQGCACCLKVYSACMQKISISEGDVSICFLLSVLTVVQSWKTCQQSSGTMPQFAMP